MKILTLARQDLMLMMRDRSSIFWVFIAPVIFVAIFGQLAGGGDDASTIRINLTVYQQEASPLADRLTEILGAENFRLTVVRPGEAGPEEPYRTLTIPEGFEAAVHAREEVSLDFGVREDANAQATFAADLAIHRAVVRLLAGEALGAMEPENDLIQVSSSWGGARKIPSGYSQTIPGYLVMFTMMSTLIYGSAGLATERKTGTIARLASAPISRYEMILGKLAGRSLIATIQASIFLILGATFFRVDWSHSPLGMAAVLLPLLLCAGAFGLLGGTLLRSPEASAGVSVVLSLVMAAMGGCWWPAEVMPRWMQAAGHIFPTAWAMDGFHRVISWGGGLSDVLAISLVLLLFAAGAGTLAVTRLDPAE